MSTSIDPLKVTPQELHRLWFMISTQEQWYAIMKECRSWFGSNWQGQSKVRRKLHKKYSSRVEPLAVWFEVPDPRFATWISVKYSLEVHSDAKHNAGK